MKKTISIVLSICFLFFLFIPNTVFASVEEEAGDWQDISLSEEEFNTILSNNPNNEIRPLASGLINAYSIAISKNGNTLIIAGQTIGATGVVKCGFTKVTIQRRKDSSSSWTDFKTYEDLYVDGGTYALAKKYVVISGYEYRVTCTHYAKKNILSVQKINNTSNTIKF